MSFLNGGYQTENGAIISEYHEILTLSDEEVQNILDNYSPWSTGEYNTTNQNSKRSEYHEILTLSDEEVQNILDNYSHWSTGEYNTTNQNSKRSTNVPEDLFIEVEHSQLQDMLREFAMPLLNDRFDETSTSLSNGLNDNEGDQTNDFESYDFKMLRKVMDITIRKQHRGYHRSRKDQPLLRKKVVIKNTLRLLRNEENRFTTWLDATSCEIKKKSRKREY